MMLIRKRNFRGALDEAYEQGRGVGRMEPPLIHVAGGTNEITIRLMRGVSGPDGSTGRAHRVLKPQDLQGFKGGILVCGYRTPLEVEQEALMRGMTLITGDGGR